MAHVFTGDAGAFCSECGTAFSAFTDAQSVTCHLCAAVYPLEKFIGIKTMTRSRDLELKFAHVTVNTAGGKGDATIKESCPQCGREEMTFKTAQLRSADEGQTIFYSCKCGYKFAVNS